MHRFFFLKQSSHENLDLSNLAPDDVRLIGLEAYASISAGCEAGRGS